MRRSKPEKNGVKGYVFNSVIVPKRDGDFNEIDVLTVSPMGIHVIEAKARVGTSSNLQALLPKFNAGVL